MTFENVLWDISFVNLTLMFADAPFYEPDDKGFDEKGKKIKKVAEATTVKELTDFLQ